MKIEHLQLEWDDLPRAEAVNLQPVEKNYLKILYTEWVIFYSVLLLVVIGLFYFIHSWQIPVVMILATIIYGLAVFVSFWLVKKAFVYKAYAFREKDILSRSGWLFQQMDIVPISKILHCVVKTGPLEKKYQLASLKIYTAGQNSDLILSGLKAEQAEQLKEWIVSKQPENG